VSRLRLVFAEAWSSVTSNVSTTVAAVVTVLIGMFLLGVVISFGSWIGSLSTHYKKQLLVNVYFDGSAQVARAQENQAARMIRQQFGDKIKSLQFKSKQEALIEQRKKHPELYSALPSNPLPDAFVVTPKSADLTEELGQAFRAANLPGVGTVNWGGRTAHRVLTVARVIWAVFVIAFALLLVASTLLIANTIRLSLFARRREIEVMKLVGATNWFIRGPFMLEGLLTGLAGALAAIVLLVVGKLVVLPAVHFDNLSTSSDVHALPFALTAIALVAAGLVLGAAGSGLTLRRFLQV
jgi:cell division transport system permease protein